MNHFPLFFITMSSQIDITINTNQDFKQLAVSNLALFIFFSISVKSKIILSLLEPGEGYDEIMTHYGIKIRQPLILLLNKY